MPGAKSEEPIRGTLPSKSLHSGIPTKNKLGHSVCGFSPTVPRGALTSGNYGATPVTINVFLNYRRDSSSGSAGRIFDLLKRCLPDAHVFMDVDSIEPGIDFLEAIDQQIRTSDYFVAVIGPGWSEAQGADGRRRLDDPNDSVRLEIEAALRREIRVVPVLVEGAKMPSANDLPESLGPFARRNAYEIAHHSFVSDVSELSKRIMRSLGIDHEKHNISVEPTRPVSWAETLFSFNGRLSRKNFWICNTVLLSATLAISWLVLSVLGDSLFANSIKRDTLEHQTVTQIALLPFWWSSFAIASKRMKDFNAGAGFLAVLALISVVVIALFFATMMVPKNADDPKAQIVLALGGMTLGALILLCVIWVAIGSIPGTPGPNRYGPEPMTR
jgi:uncharacterized membrane protein YhaH (DUF805 family)